MTLYQWRISRQDLEEVQGRENEGERKSVSERERGSMLDRENDDLEKSQGREGEREKKREQKE